MNGSKPFTINSADVSRIGRGALVAVAGALVVYVVEVMPTIDFGVWTPLAVAVAGVAVNAARVWISNNSLS